MEEFVPTSDEGIDPIAYVSSYFTQLSEKEISVLVGAITLLGEVKYKVLRSVLDIEQLDVEEKIGRLMQTDLLDGKFTDDSFVLYKLNYPILKQHPNLILDDRIMLAYLKARYELTLDEIGKAFNLNYESIIHVLSIFISKGLISTRRKDETTFLFIVHYELPSRLPEEITDLEKQIVGLGILRGSITIDDLVAELEEPEFRIQATLFNLILANLITCTFTIENKMFGGIVLQIEIDRFQLHFEKKEIQLLNNSERALIGLVGLREQIALSEIVSILKLTESEILKIVSQLTATNQFSFTLSSNNILSLDEKLSFPVNRSIETLSSISTFNYRVLIGILQTQKRVKVGDIATKMREVNKDVLTALIDLYLEGLIVGKLNERYEFTLTAVKRPEQGNDITLKRWERILLGALIAEDVLTWPKISALLEIDRLEVRDRTFEFITHGIGGAYAKDTIVSLEGKPQMPPLSQISELDPIEQQLLGFLSGYKRISNKEIQSHFNLRSIAVFRLVYYLCGSGLIEIRRDKNNFEIIRSNLGEPMQPISKLDTALKQTIEVIQNTSENSIRISQISKNLDTSKSNIFRYIGYLLANGYYKGNFTNGDFIRSSRLRTSSTVLFCFNCNHQISKSNQTCKNCGSELPTCSVCKGSLTSSDRLVACPHCAHMAHHSHMREWLKIKGQCPICRNSINESQLIIREISLG